MGHTTGGDTRGTNWLLVALHLCESRSLTWHLVSNVLPIAETVVNGDDLDYWRRGAVFMYMSFAAPNKRSLGTTNGLAQTIVSIQRTIGPAAVTALFAFSEQ